MRNIVLGVLSLILIHSSQAQERRLEFTPYVKFDSYPTITSNYGGRFFTDTLSMKGTSPGFTIKYTHELPKGIHLRVGIGYHKYSFTKLTRKSYRGTSHARPIDYPSPFSIFFHTNKYHYNTVLLNIGAEKILLKTKTSLLSAGINYSAYFSFEGVYKLTALGETYHQKGFSLFGHSVDLSLSYKKKMGTWLVGPTVSLPLIDIWSQDGAFREIGSAKRSKWLNGFAVGFSVSVPIGSKK